VARQIGSLVKFLLDKQKNGWSGYVRRRSEHANGWSGREKKASDYLVIVRCCCCLESQFETVDEKNDSWMKNVRKCGFQFF